jgi:hypothetical protein
MMSHRRCSRILPAAFVLACLAGGAPADGQATRPSEPPATRPASSQAAALPHLRIDPAKRTIEMDTHVALTDGVLELLICRANSKEHESILATPALPSHVHAALLALGLTPGRPAYWTKDASGQNVCVPPAGPPLKITLRYTDATSQEHSVGPEQWLLTQAGGKPVQKLDWVFVGSSPDGNGYPADETGDLVCLSNFPDSVIDVPFVSTEADSFQEFRANPAAIPPIGTAVTAVISVEPSALKADVARAVFDVDRFGRYKLDGLAITPEQIEQWGPQFAAEHKRAYAVVLASARALVFDVERLKSLLAGAGIEDVDVRMQPVAGEILPRTPEQSAQAVQWWRDQFARYAELIHEPGSQAQTVLRQIEFSREELADLSQLWSSYERQMVELLRAYRAATRPSATQPATPAGAASRNGK